MRVVWSLAVPAAALLATNPARGVTLLDLADSLAAAGFPDDAITEYKRAVFLGAAGERAGAAFAKMGDCYARLGNWSAARAALDSAARRSAGAPSEEARRLERARVLIASGSPAEARADLESMALHSPLAQSRARARLMLLTSAVISRDWPAAREAHRRMVPDPGATGDEVGEALRAAAAAPRKSPETALMLSMLVPGAGQAYAGRWRNGLGALLLDGALGYLVARSVTRGEYAAAALEFGFGFRRYYEGNLGRARAAAIAWNDRVDRESRMRVLRSLDREYGAGEAADRPRAR